MDVVMAAAATVPVAGAMVVVIVLGLCCVCHAYRSPRELLLTTRNRETAGPYFAM
jgi:hypothetical protein